ncbi:stress enhanced protein 2, chloroplastic [Phalaenopsis equestris]|uniref:stress enhanced protein 2, chloroplastic n=1 Tax=Phalaenopsis equestris TaxID=78828 RepID=UPI0009E5692E|nr:stress enhanced protein 2, chloroplastic [Phalaenopsis equestris]
MVAAIAHMTILCELAPAESAFGRSRDLPAIPRLRSAADLSPASGKIILQPRLCTLRSYGSGKLPSPVKNSGTNTSFFFASLADYVDSARKSHDFEIISGRLAMIAFAAAVGEEFVTGNSLFKKLDCEEIAGAAGVLLAVVTSAAVFAWLSMARTRIGKMLTLSCNSFVDSLVDNIIDGLFYENDPIDWSDET